MDKVLEFLNAPMVIMALQFVAGFGLKKYPAFPNKFIPIATYVLALFGFAVVPKEANAASLVATVLPISALLPLGNVFLTALAQNLVVGGMHTQWKNCAKPVLGAVLNATLGKWLNVGGKK